MHVRPVPWENPINLNGDSSNCAVRAVFTSSEVYFRITPLIITLETQSAKCENIQLWLIEEG